MKMKNQTGGMSAEERYQHAYMMLGHWLEALYQNHRAAEYFIDAGYRDIAIYGMGDLANRLMDDLQGSVVRVCYGIDREVAGTVCRIENIYSPDEELMPIDAVVVTPFYAFDKICENLEGKISCPVISIEEVIWSI